MGGIDVEVLATDVWQGDERITSVMFPVPNTGTWAIVQTCGSGGRWAIGFDGWQHDEFPGLHEAVTAICDPKVRRQILARTAAARAVFELQQRARAAFDALPAIPDGACPSPWPGVVP